MHSTSFLTLALCLLFIPITITAHPRSRSVPPSAEDLLISWAKRDYSQDMRYRVLALTGLSLTITGCYCAIKSIKQDNAIRDALQKAYSASLAASGFLITFCSHDLISLADFYRTKELIEQIKQLNAAKKTIFSL